MSAIRYLEEHIRGFANFIPISAQTNAVDYDVNNLLSFLRNSLRQIYAYDVMQFDANRYVDDELEKIRIKDIVDQQMWEVVRLLRQTPVDIYDIA